jgi:hypothetical protein
MSIEDLHYFIVTDVHSPFHKYNRALDTAYANYFLPTL